MKLFIPPVGSRLCLTSDWTFSLYHEKRNTSLRRVFDPSYVLDWGLRGKVSDFYTLPKGTVLEVDRVYIRTTSKSAKTEDDNYDSVTFRVVKHVSYKKHPRFWAKLADVNTIEYEVPGDATEAVSKGQERASESLSPTLAISRLRKGLIKPYASWVTPSVEACLKGLHKYFVERNRKLKISRLYEEWNHLFPALLENQRKVHVVERGPRRVWHWTNPCEGPYFLEGLAVEVETEGTSIVGVRWSVPIR